MLKFMIFKYALITNFFDMDQFFDPLLQNSKQALQNPPFCQSVSSQAAFKVLAD
jgi:hypothetical protein